MFVFFERTCAKRPRVRKHGWLSLAHTQPHSLHLPGNRLEQQQNKQQHQQHSKSTSRSANHTTTRLSAVAAENVHKTLINNSIENEKSRDHLGRNLVGSAAVCTAAISIQSSAEKPKQATKSPNARYSYIDRGLDSSSISNTSSTGCGAGCTNQST